MVKTDIWESYFMYNCLGTTLTPGESRLYYTILIESVKDFLKLYIFLMLAPQDVLLKSKRTYFFRIFWMSVKVKYT